jgi:hypothetical protein
MIVKFTVSEFKDLFTTSDYKHLIKAVEDHFNENASYQGVETKVVAYYNPGKNEGVVIVKNINEYIYVENLEVAYGTDFITVKFKC